MQDALQNLEVMVKRLLERVDSLETENESIRAVVNDKGSEMSQQELVRQLEGLKLEKAKLEKKMSLAQGKLDGLIDEIDKLEL